MKGMARVALALALLVSCRGDKPAPSDTIVKKRTSASSIAPMEMSLKSDDRTENSAEGSSRKRPSPSPFAARALASSSVPAPSMRPGGSPPAIPGPGDLAPGKRVRDQAKPTPRIQETGPFSLLPLGVSEYRYPEDFSLGPLEPRIRRSDPRSDPSALAYAAAEALVKKTGIEALAAPGRASVIAQALRPYLASEAKAVSFRLGALNRSGDSAEGRIFFFGQNGSRVVAELYLAKRGEAWGVDGVAGNLAALIGGEIPERRPYDPGEYRVFSY